VDVSTQAVSRRRDHLTFKGNLAETRYGWLRLTPAYSVHLVSELLDANARAGSHVLDPYCGTGTTALVCAERGLACDTTDINPFLIWLAKAKTRAYSASERQRACSAASEVSAAMAQSQSSEPAWAPALHQIEKWWSGASLQTLARGMSAIQRLAPALPEASADLLKLAFCRSLIAHAHVSFAHQSMSFKKAERRGPAAGAAELAASFEMALSAIATAAESGVARAPEVRYCDARDLTTALAPGRYACVITSPPYPNRMSYIRELRPYMFWLGYLQDGREAGELDWQAIGGTWGCATSNVAKWSAPGPLRIPFREFDPIVEAISKRSPVLGKYVCKYFHDMTSHCRSLFHVVAPEGTVHYIVGNSKFYDTLLPVEHIYAAMFRAAGFVDPNVRAIRKRSSKRELFEFVVSARKPSLAG
jgi:hypothetical protein